MAVFFIVAVSFGVAAAAFLTLGLPLLRSEMEETSGRLGDVLRVRLDSIERGRISGLIGDDDAAEVAIEAKRAAIRADSAAEAVGISKPLRFLAILFLALMPIAAGSLYLKVGSPKLVVSPKAPQISAIDAEAIADLPAKERRAIIESMVASLSDRLEETPEDAEGWRMLARSQYVLGDPIGSAASYRRLLSLEEGTVEDWRNFSATLIASFPEGRFPTDQEFMAALDEIEKREPDDAMVLFYRGGAAREAGNQLLAIELWTRLLAGMPNDAPVRETLERLITEARDDAGSSNVSK